LHSSASAGVPRGIIDTTDDLTRAPTSSSGWRFWDARTFVSSFDR
jgi:hypothetical protein